ncbi:SRPBCC domain-containing protein [Paenibacillus oenotherae]|uniref:SRPBCC domain-containing protein n=1 Tax=Paenibacillus oenotherae TaxID=1435645 RepID=A0ABS7D209_9BACL|nr:SRPBCC domain-containing protein [Paenibacillus oenotherae]
MSTNEHGGNSLTYEIRITAKPERVWAAVATSEGSKATLFGCSMESTFEPGARIEFRGQGPDGDNTLHVYGFVRHYEPYVEFSYEQHPAPAYNENHETVRCNMTFKLIPDGDATRLVLTCAWSPGNPGYEHAKAEYPASSYVDAIKSFAELC